MGNKSLPILMQHMTPFMAILTLISLFTAYHSKALLKHNVTKLPESSLDN